MKSSSECCAQQAIRSQHVEILRIVKSQNDSLRVQVLSLLAECQRQQMDKVVSIFKKRPYVTPQENMSEEEYEAEVQRLVSVENEELLNVTDRFAPLGVREAMKRKKTTEGLSGKSMEYLQATATQRNRRENNTSEGNTSSSKYRFSKRYTSSRVMSPDVFKRGREILAVAQQQELSSRLSQRVHGSQMYGTRTRPTHRMEEPKKVYKETKSPSLSFVAEIQIKKKRQKTRKLCQTMRTRTLLDHLLFPRQHRPIVNMRCIG
jgi:hypothetical protein